MWAGNRGFENGDHWRRIDRVSFSYDLIIMGYGGVSGSSKGFPTVG